MEKSWQTSLNYEQKLIVTYRWWKGRSKTKKNRKSVIKGKLKFENYKNCFEATQLENKTSIRNE